MRLITHLTHLRYQIGFTGTSGFMLLNTPKGEDLFFTDFRYKGLAEALEKDAHEQAFRFIQLDEQGYKILETILKKHTVEFEADHMTVNELKKWKGKFPQTRFIPTKKPFEQNRLIKNSKEIHELKRSQKINEATLHQLKNHLKPGVSELETAWLIKSIGHDLGADDISFEPIVAFGAHSAIPHHQNSASKLKINDIVLIDMGMKVNGYCSDMTRTLLPKKASAEQQNVYDKVLTAQKAAEKICKAGVLASKMDKVARESMGKDASYFGHSLGHGIGLDVHEAPSVSSRSKDRLKAGMIITIEPGIYLDGKFGVRIEDMGLVTETGYDNFTTAEK